MSTEEPDDKTIPTLVDVVVEGKTKVDEQTRQNLTSHTPPMSQHSTLGDHSSLRASLNAKIEALIAEVLIRHMDEARKEIIRRVFSEINNHLDQTSKSR